MDNIRLRIELPCMNEVGITLHYETLKAVLTVLTDCNDRGIYLDRFLQTFLVFLFCITKITFFYLFSL